MERHTPVRIRLVGAMIFLLATLTTAAAYHAQRHRLVLPEVQDTTETTSPTPPTPSGLATPAPLSQAETGSFFVASKIGSEIGEKQKPRIANVRAEDLDQDGLLDVIVCDVRRHAVRWIRQSPRGVFVEQPCGQMVRAPAHAEPTDIDQDGDMDLLVASLGRLYPTNDKIGSVVVLENDGRMAFVNHVIAEKIPRTSDVRGGDLDGDGDMDLAVTMFGAFDGGTGWLENTGGWRFKLHWLQHLAGPINCEIADIDKDGDLDIAVLVSQNWEEIYIFLNDGQGSFTPRVVYGATNEDYGSSHMRLVDLDRDGDLDILYTNGDSWDFDPPRPQPWHGVQWLENTGPLQFVFHRITDLGGVYAALPFDVDADDDLDIVALSMFNDWENPDAQSIVLLENDGQCRFVRHDMETRPTHIQTGDWGDFDGDGHVDFVTGGMYTFKPFGQISRLLLWRNRTATAVD